TACSSSLVTTHLACQSLRNRECDIAFSGGVNLMLSPEMTIGLCELQALSPEGRCKTFDAGANGYVRGEGCGVVALMRLSDALAQERPIRALIRGSAVNHDGRSNGMTAPNGRAQREVIHEALVRAGVAPADVDYVEAHGTGTALGDPIELRALHDVYCRDVGRSEDLQVGSIKTNIGHLEAAASVASLIKVVCALQKGELPKHLHLEVPTSHVDWAGNRIRVVDRHMPWPSSRPGHRMAGISAFGMSGTNAHLIVEAYRGDDRRAVDAPDANDFSAPPDEGPQIFPLSAHTPAMLRQAVADCTGWLQQRPGLRLVDFARALRLGRDTQRHRVAVVASDRAALRAQMKGLLQAGSPPVPRASSGRLAFLFTGQGAQYHGMARTLYPAFPAFREAFDECDRHFEALSGGSLVDLLSSGDPCLVDNTAFTQPALFAIETALARLWSSWGVVPDVLMGHSVGEYAAACLAGVFSLEDGVNLVAARGRLMQSLTPSGKMSAVFASADHVAPYLGRYAGRVDLAGDNAPESVVVSGDPAALDDLAAELRRDGIDTRPLGVSRAFHSPLMAPMLDEFRRVAEAVTYRAPTLPLVSNLSGRFESERFCDPSYWVEHVRRTVRFRDGMQTLFAEGVDTFVEVGPGKVLTGLAAACAAGRSSPEAIRCLHSIDAQHDERLPLLQSLAALYVSGRRVDWRAFEGSNEAVRRAPPVALPPYPLEQGAYWVGTRRAATGTRPVHSTSPRRAPLADGWLGPELRLPALPDRRFEHRVSLAELPVLRGHGVHDRVIFPAAGYVAMALEAALRMRSDDGLDDAAQPALALRGVSIDRPLPLPPEQAVSLLSILNAAGPDGTARLDIHAKAGDSELWTPCASATLVSAAGDHGPSLQQQRDRCAESVDVDAFYRQLHEAGLRYAGGFRSVRELSRGPGLAVGRIELDPAHRHEASPVIHPALLDAALQVVAAALSADGEAGLHLPIGLNRIECRPVATSATLWCVAEVTDRRPLVNANLVLFDGAGQWVASLSGLKLAPVEAHRRLNAPSAASVCEMQWQPWKVPAVDAADRGRCLVIGDGSDLESAMRAQLQRAESGGIDFVAVATDELEEEGLRQALERFACSAPGGSHLSLLYLWPSGCDTSETPATERPDAVSRAYHRFAAVWRTVQATDWNGRPARLCVVTQSAQGLPADPHVLPEQAAAWGLVRSLMHEGGEPALALIDLPGPEPRPLETCLRIARAAALGNERQFVVRDDAVHVPRLMRRQLPKSPKPLAPGAYLVTGGRGAIGTLLIEWLIGQGVPKVVAASRRPPVQADRDRLGKLATAARTRLEYVEVDLADGAAVQGLVDWIAADRRHPLKGVFHAAGVLDDGFLLTQPGADVDRVLAPKVAGSLHLHRATARLALDHFVSFSSIVACIGSPGQCAYGAANAYLDALSQQRNREGLPGHAINWGLWGGPGMAEQLDAQQLRRIEAFGLRPLDPHQALQALSALLGEPHGQSQVWQVDADVLLERSDQPALHALLSGLASPEPAVARSAAAAAAVGFGAEVRRLPAPQRAAALTHRLVTSLAQTLQVAVDRVDPQTPLIELGLDSLMAAELRSSIRSELGVDVPFGQLLEGATVQDVVRTVLANLDQHKDRAAPRPAAAPPAPRLMRLDAVSREARFDAEKETGQL
ncbi:MAG: SDR family NAD(P)-dependent oxidoreductase, partial [Rhizobacter sp.]